MYTPESSACESVEFSGNHSFTLDLSLDPYFAWAGRIFSPVVLLCQFFVLGGNRFWFYILLMYLGYRIIQLWCCVSFQIVFFGPRTKWS